MGWALHCLEPEDEAFLAQHLQVCTDCARTVAQTEEVGGLLASIVPQLDPPAQLQHRILAAAQSIRPRAATGEVASPTGSPRLVRRRQHVRWRALRVPAAAAAVVLVGLTAGLGVYAAQVNSDRDSLAAARAADAAVLSKVIDSMVSPAGERIPLAAGDDLPVAVVLADDTTLTVVSTHLPVNHADLDNYVLWGLGIGGPKALVTFDIAGDLHPTVRTASRPAPFTAYALCIEPELTPPTAPARSLPPERQRADRPVTGAMSLPSRLSDRQGRILDHLAQRVRPAIRGWAIAVSKVPLPPPRSKVWGAFSLFHLGESVAERRLAACGSTVDHMPMGLPMKLLHPMRSDEGQRALFVQSGRCSAPKAGPEAT